MLANNLEDVEEKMNFSFEGGATVDASMTVEPKWQQHIERSDSFGNVVEEVKEESSVLARYGIQKLQYSGGGGDTQPRHQTNVSMRSCTSGLSQATSGKRDQAPNKERQRDQRLKNRSFTYFDSKPLQSPFAGSQRKPSMADQVTQFNPFKQLHSAMKPPIYGGESPLRPRTSSLNSVEQPPVKLFEASMEGTTAEEFLP